MGTTKRMRQKAGRQARLETARAAQARSKRRRSYRNVVLIVLLIVIAAVVFAAVGGGDDDVATTDSSTTFPTFDTTPQSTASTPSTTPGVTITGETPCPAADGSSTRTIGFETAPPTCIDAAKTYTAVFETTAGTVTVALDPTTVPNAVNDFVVLARYHYFDGTSLFRTDPSIGIIQGGSPNTQDASDPGPGFAVEDEGGDFDFTDPSNPKGPFTYVAGDLVLARSSGPDSSGGQFFFGVTADVSNLDGQGTYIKLGTTTAGLDVLEAILATHVPDTTGAVLGGSPSPPVYVLSVTIEEA